MMLHANPNTDEPGGSIVLWFKIYAETDGERRRWKVNHNLFLSAQWRIAKTDRHSFRCAQQMTFREPRLFTLELYETREAFVTFTVCLVHGRCETTVLLNYLIVPVCNYSGWCSQMRSERRVWSCRYTLSYRNLRINKQKKLQNREFCVSTTLTPQSGIWTEFNGWLPKMSHWYPVSILLTVSATMSLAFSPSRLLENFLFCLQYLIS